MMKIEVWGSSDKWYWHFIASNGKITADAESFPTKAHAIRAAKAVVRAVIKPMDLFDGGPVRFTTTVNAIGVTVIKWA